MLTCGDRAEVLASTLASLSACGWQEDPEIVMDGGEGQTRLERIHRTWRRVINRAASASTDFVLLLEDDLRFGKWFEENLTEWPLLCQVQPGGGFYASLYNPGLPFIRRCPAERCVLAYPGSAWGGQALLMTPRTAHFIDEHWNEAHGNPDQRMPRLAGRVAPIYLAAPSLVDHAPVPTTWGGREHCALDFDHDFRARASHLGAKKDAGMSARSIR